MYLSTNILQIRVGSIAEPVPTGVAFFFLAGAGADLKFDLEPDPIFWVVYGSFFWQLSIKLNNFFILSKSIFSKVFPCLGQNVCFWDKT